MNLSPRAFALPVLLTALACHSGPPVRADEVHTLVKQGAVLLDVRGPEEFAAGHLDGALNIPVQVLEGQLSQLPKKDRAIVVYCRSGARSARARQLLLAAGYTSVTDLGAMTNW